MGRDRVTETKERAEIWASFFYTPSGAEGGAELESGVRAEVVESEDAQPGYVSPTAYRCFLSKSIPSANTEGAEMIE